MVILQKIIEKFEEFAPPELAGEWDNVGLMVGDFENDIKKAVVVLDVTAAVIDFAIENKCELIVSHHPFIMSLGKSMAYDTHLNKMIYKLIKNDISVYSMHTNFDSCSEGVNSVICDMLDLDYTKDETNIIWSGKLKKEKTLAEFIEMVKTTFCVNAVSYSGDLSKKINAVAVCGGGGGSFIDMAKFEINADVYFTGEVKYHDFQHGLSIDLPIVTAGHFETENPSLYKIRDLLKSLKIEVAETDLHKGFSQINV